MKPSKLDNKITNEMLIDFLETRIDLLKSENYSDTEFLSILGFFVEHIKPKEELSDAYLKDCAMLGWVLQHMLKPTEPSS